MDYMGDWTRVVPRDLSPRGYQLGAASPWILGERARMSSYMDGGRAAKPGFSVPQRMQMAPIPQDSFTTGTSAAWNGLGAPSKVHQEEIEPPEPSTMAMYFQNGDRNNPFREYSFVPSGGDWSSSTALQEQIECMFGSVAWLEKVIGTCVEEMRRYKHRIEALETRLREPADKRFSRAVLHNNWNKQKVEEVCLENSKLFKEVELARRELDNTKYRMGELEAANSRLEGERDQLCYLIQELDARATSSISKLQGDITDKDSQILLLHRQIREMKAFAQDHSSSSSVTNKRASTFSELRQELELMKQGEQSNMQQFNDVRDVRVELRHLKRSVPPGMLHPTPGEGTKAGNSMMNGYVRPSNACNSHIATPNRGADPSLNSAAGSLYSSGSGTPAALLNGSLLGGTPGAYEVGAVGPGMTGASGHWILEMVRNKANSQPQSPSFRQQIRATPNAYHNHQNDTNSSSRPSPRIQSPDHLRFQSPDIEASFHSGERSNEVDQEQLRKRAMALRNLATSYPELFALDQNSLKSMSDLVSPGSQASLEFDQKFLLDTELLLAAESDNPPGHFGDPAPRQVAQRRPSQEDIRSFIQKGREQTIEEMWEMFREKQELDRLPSGESAFSDQTSSSADPSSYPSPKQTPLPQSPDAHVLDRLHSLPKELREVALDTKPEQTHGTAVSANSEHIDPEIALQILNRHPSLATASDHGVQGELEDEDGSSRGTCNSTEAETSSPRVEPFHKSLLANLDLHRKASVVPLTVDPASTRTGSMSRTPTSYSPTNVLVTPRNVGFLNVSRNAAYSSREDGTPLYASTDDAAEIAHKVSRTKNSAMRKIAALFSFKHKMSAALGKTTQQSERPRLDTTNVPEQDANLGSPDNPVSHNLPPQTPRRTIPKHQMQQNMKVLQDFWERTSSVVAQTDAGPETQTPSPPSSPSAESFGSDSRQGQVLDVISAEKTEGESLLDSSGAVVEQSLSLSAVLDRNVKVPSTITEKELEEFTPIPSAHGQSSLDNTPKIASLKAPTMAEEDDISLTPSRDLRNNRNGGQLDRMQADVPMFHSNPPARPAEEERSPASVPPAMMLDQVQEMMQDLRKGSGDLSSEGTGSMFRGNHEPPEPDLRSHEDIK